MSVLDLWLNMAIKVEPCSDTNDLATLFEKRATSVRAGVRGSPRGLKTPRLADYKGFKTVQLPAYYELVFESTTPKSGLPLNMCARRLLSVELFGPVFLVRRLDREFISLSQGVFDSIHGPMLAEAAAGAKLKAPRRK